jgi:predicted amidohydrolase YtcJ
MMMANCRSRRMAQSASLFGTLVAAMGQALAGAVASDPAPDRPPRVVADVVLKGGTVIDGTGGKARPADVALRRDRIVAVGSFEYDPRARVIDVSSLVVAPGFIDLHTHSDPGISQSVKRANQNYLTQGVTTVVTGNCGLGVGDVAKYLATIDFRGAGTNVIHLIPHGAIRGAVMGNAERPPTPDELEKMKRLVDRGMEAGAWGLSSGLIYVPGRYAATSELIELARVVHRHGGLYASHIRNEAEKLLESVDEAVTIGKAAGTPVHISHLKASGKAYWGSVGPALARIAKARQEGQRVTADQYPYIASSTKLEAMIVPHWAIKGTTADFNRMAADPVKGAALKREIAQALETRDGGASIRIAHYAPRPQWAGLDLASIAGRERKGVVDIVLEIQGHGGAQAISFGMDEDDVREVMRHEFVATASDGSTQVPTAGDRPHPRSFGTFPRKIRYALDDKILTLEQAVRSCSGLPAEILGIPDRGVIRAGNFADLVVFDPATFRDAATFERPTLAAPGVQYLFVNGKLLIAQGNLQVRPDYGGMLPGRSLRLNRDGPAGLIVKLKRIWTGDSDNPWAQALAARAGVIAAIGTLGEVERFRGPSTRVLELPAAFATPGLIDAHGHLESLGATHEEIDLRGVKSLAEVAERVKARAELTPGDSWITGRSWDQSLWPGGNFPTAAVLDAAAPHRAVWLKRVDGHAGWASSEAMRRAGVDKNSKAPTNGQILRDAAGEPTGVFVDGAMSLVAKAIPAATKEDTKRKLLTAQKLVLQNGLTSVHDAGISRSVTEVYQQLDRDGQLVVRVYAMASIPADGEATVLARRPPESAPGSRFELRAIKLFIDGAMGSRGALLFEPYHDDPGNSGLLLIDPNRLESITTLALRRGWQVCTHAIGDKGNALVLDAYSKARRTVPEARNTRLRIEHAQVVRKDDVRRFAELGVIASMQPSHASDDMRWADARLGSGRVDGAYAWRWFVEAGVVLAHGSDFPVEVVNPLWGIYAGVTRQDAQGNPPGGWHPEQKLTLEETIRGFTAGAAYASFAENRLGVLKPGWKADLTIFDRDLFLAKPADLLSARVAATVIDGTIVYDAATKTPNP